MEPRMIIELTAHHMKKETLEHGVNTGHKKKKAEDITASRA